MAWAATPAEIEAAFTGLVDYTIWVNGGDPDKDRHPPKKASQAEIAAAFRARFSSKSTAEAPA